MKNFLATFLPFLLNLFDRGYRILKEYVIPCILFVEQIKYIISEKLYAEKEYWKDEAKILESFAQRLNRYANVIERLILVFMDVVIIVIPELNTGKPVTFIEMLNMFIKHIRSLSNVQRGWVFFKIASLMAMQMTKDRYDYKEHQTDFLTQLCYTKYKSTGKL